MKTLPLSIKLEDFKRLLSKTRKPQHKIAFILAFFSGLRISEILHLKKEDIDLAGKKVFVRLGKGSKDRIAPLPKGFTEKSLAIIPLTISARALQKSFKNKINKLGLNSRLHFHSLRHGFATRAIEQGIPLNQVQLLLGHSNIATTSIYLKANPEDALKSYEDKF